MKILYEDDSLLIVNKPAGLVTLNTPTYKEKTLQSYIEDEFKLTFNDRAGIVHRLDKDTQGIILIARDDKTFSQLQKQFKERKVTKEYLALVRGKVVGSNKIVAPIGRSSHSRFKFAVVPGGKKAETEYSVLKNLKIGGEDYSLVKVGIKTGRTHQIRVHFKYLGHPLYGDSIYGTKEDEDRPLFLIARKLEFLHPHSQKKIRVSIDIPGRFKSIIEYGKENPKEAKKDITP